jgi:hypothetical protein
LKSLSLYPGPLAERPCALWSALLRVFSSSLQFQTITKTWS